MQREKISEKFPIGSQMPSFSLVNVDGTQVSNEFFKDAKLCLVIFTCNHCPYVKGSEDMLGGIIKNFAVEGLKVVSINSNDARQYPEDSYEKMKEKAKQHNLPYPYLYDESQSVARTFDAACTPECYLFDARRNLIWHGTINDQPKDPSLVKTDFLTKAIMQGLETGKCEPHYVHPIGCSIKWK